MVVIIMVMVIDRPYAASRRLDFPKYITTNVQTIHKNQLMKGM